MSVFNINVNPVNRRKTAGKCIEKVCNTCGKKFYVSIGYGKGLYCSKNCADKAKISKAIIISIASTKVENGTFSLWAAILINNCVGIIS